MEQDKLQALYFAPLESLAGMMEDSAATADDCADLLRLVLAGIKARMEQA